MATIKIIIDMLYLDARAEAVLAWVVNTLGADPELDIEFLDMKEWFIPTNDGAGVRLIQKGAAKIERNRMRFTPADCLVLLRPDGAGPRLLAPLLAEFAPLWRGVPALLVGYGATEACPAQSAFIGLLHDQGLCPAPKGLHLRLGQFGQGDLIFGLTVAESLQHLEQALCAAVRGRLSARDILLS